MGHFPGTIILMVVSIVIVVTVILSKIIGVL